MVYMLLGTGFEETEAIAPLDLLRRAGIEVKTVTLSGKTVYGAHNIGIEADIFPEQIELTDMDMVVLPGGMGGVASIRASEDARFILEIAHSAGKYIAAICAAPTVLADMNITDGKKVVCYPGCEELLSEAEILHVAAVTDGKLITGTSAGCAIPFGLELIRALKGDKAAANIERQIVIR